MKKKRRIIVIVGIIIIGLSIYFGNHFIKYVKDNEWRYKPILTIHLEEEDDLGIILEEIFKDRESEKFKLYWNGLKVMDSQQINGQF